MRCDGACPAILYCSGQYLLPELQTCGTTQDSIRSLIWALVLLAIIIYAFAWSPDAAAAVTVFLFSPSLAFFTIRLYTSKKRFAYTYLSTWIEVAGERERERYLSVYLSACLPVRLSVCLLIHVSQSTIIYTIFFYVHIFKCHGKCLQALPGTLRSSVDRQPLDPSRLSATVF